MTTPLTGERRTAASGEGGGGGVSEWEEAALAEGGSWYTWPSNRNSEQTAEAPPPRT